MAGHVLSSSAPHPDLSYSQESPSARRPRGIFGLPLNRQAAVVVVVGIVVLAAKGAAKQSGTSTPQGAKELAFAELWASSVPRVSTLQARTEGLRVALLSLKEEDSNSTAADGKEVASEGEGENTNSSGSKKQEKGAVTEEPRKQSSVGGGTPDEDGGMMDVEPGWNKAYWSSSAWASWIITGPLISVLFAFFMFYTYGVPAGVLTLLVCSFIDAATYYYNW
mmetsp:Transcript_914/g.1539  ORF Transcript_914/g.1539 Transcript_914/m.1539 type:complete len:222 (-) Transcript_914:146-811(-)